MSFSLFIHSHLHICARMYAYLLALCSRFCLRLCSRLWSRCQPRFCSDCRISFAVLLCFAAFCSRFSWHFFFPRALSPIVPGMEKLARLLAFACAFRCSWPLSCGWWPEGSDPRRWRDQLASAEFTDILKRRFWLPGSFRKLMVVDKLEACRGGDLTVKHSLKATQRRGSAVSRARDVRTQKTNPYRRTSILSERQILG